MLNDPSKVTKGNVLLQNSGIGPDLVHCIGEVNPDKFGCMTPGTRIPIVSEEEMRRENPDARVEVSIGAQAPAQFEAGHFGQHPVDEDPERPLDQGKLGKVRPAVQDDLEIVMPNA